MFRTDREEYEHLRDQVFQMEDETSSDGKLESPSLIAASEIDENEEEDGESEEPAPVVSDYPRERVKSAIVDFLDGFDSKKLAVVRNLARVANRLRPLSAARLAEVLKGPDTADAKTYLNEIIAWADQAKKLI